MTEITMVGVALTFLAILAGMFINNRRFDEAERRTDERFNRVDERFNRVDGRLDRVELRLDKMNADMGQFYHVTGRLEGRIDSLESRKS